MGAVERVSLVGLYRFLQFLYKNCSLEFTLPIKKLSIHGPQGFWGTWEKGFLIIRELGSTANYLSGAGEQGHTFWDLGRTAKK